MSRQPVQIDLYSDLHCPFAYITVYRLRQLRAEYRGQIVINHKCLSLEYVNRQPTPKPVLDAELPILMAEEPAIPYQPWSRPASEWPVTMWPAFEAVKCAQRQGVDIAAELDWAIRLALFAQSRCISMRHVLLELAEGVGLDMTRFVDDFDRGVAKQLVLQESRAGWETLKVNGSPTFVLPSGQQVSGLALPKIELDEQQNYRVVSVQPAECAGNSCLDSYRQMFDRVVRQ